MQPGDLEDVEAAAPRLPLTPDEAASLTALVGRMDLLMREATALGVQVYVDAEQSYFQGAIDALAMEMMRRHNMDGSTTCATTYQCYRCVAHVHRQTARVGLGVRARGTAIALE